MSGPGGVSLATRKRHTACLTRWRVTYHWLVVLKPDEDSVPKRIAKEMKPMIINSRYSFLINP